MSAKEVLMTARNPYWSSAQGACSRELPQPKLSPASRICDLLAPGWLRMKSFFGDGLQESRRNDLVRVDVVHGKRHQTAFERCEFLHYSNVLTSVTTPVTALAAAVSGLARKVRPPLPWRPSKLRLLVETLYWPG